MVGLSTRVPGRCLHWILEGEVNPPIRHSTEQVFQSVMSRAQLEISLLATRFTAHLWEIQLSTRLQWVTRITKKSERISRTWKRNAFHSSQDLSICSMMTGAITSRDARVSSLPTSARLSLKKLWSMKRNCLLQASTTTRRP